MTIIMIIITVVALLPNLDHFDNGGRQPTLNPKAAIEPSYPMSGSGDAFNIGKTKPEALHPKLVFKGSCS